MKRRGFISSIAAIAALWPLAGAAQVPERVRRIGMLMGYAESDPDTQANLAALWEALQRLGWAEDHNIRIEMRWAIPADRDRCDDPQRSWSRFGPISFFQKSHPRPPRCSERRALSPSCLYGFPIQ